MISPYSTVNAIILLSQTTDGKTLAQLKNKFNFTATEAELFDTYVAYQESLAKSARRSTFIVANKLYVQKWYDLSENFKEIATKKLQTDVEVIDFTNQIGAAKIINSFTEGKTQNRTGDIIEPTQLAVFPRVILMSTMYININFEKVILLSTELCLTYALTKESDSLVVIRYFNGFPLPKTDLILSMHRIMKLLLNMLMLST